MHRGGHDPLKVYNAYKAAVEHKGGPTVILAKTVKGYGLGTNEGRNATHQQKKLNEENVKFFRTRFEIPIPDEAARDGALYRPPDSSPEIAYMQERRRVLGGYLPMRNPAPSQTTAPGEDLIAEFKQGSKEPHPSSTMAFVKLLGKLLKAPGIGKKIVPIIPDEARTFGMESMFRTYGIYASGGQLYKPEDADMLLYYKEAKDGQVLEEGITEGGSMAEFTAAGTAYANYGVDMIPFYIYYSMFGFQRVGDLIWAFADSRGKGFLMGGTAGRTTLNGEGLQHQDGHSLLLASTVPTLAAYDPCFAYEIAVIVRDGIRRMYENREDLFYYITLYNENYPQAAMPEGSEEGILKGLYLFSKSGLAKPKARVQLLGSGPILTEAIKAAEILAEKYNVAADVWSATSYNELRREALKVDRWNRLHPAEPAKTPVCPAVARLNRRSDHRGFGLYEERAGPDRAVAAGSLPCARYRWLRTQRKPPVSAGAFRNQCGVDCRGGIVEAGARRQVRSEEGREGAHRAGNRPRKRRFGNRLRGRKRSLPVPSR